MSADEVPTSDHDTTATTPHDETPQDETKRKFREALEAKKNRRGEDHIDDGKQHVHAHGPVDSKRVFRRKTG
ncbi:MAG TPA: DUF5302 domain-containing protein [Propionibacteriaceae bacterium]|jgi:hypothetical protein